jgi:hypothetical protein
MKEMGLIKMLDKDYKGCRGWNVTLIDANIWLDRLDNKMIFYYNFVYLIIVYDNNSNIY